MKVLMLVHTNFMGEPRKPGKIYGDIPSDTAKRWFTKGIAKPVYDKDEDDNKEKVTEEKEVVEVNTKEEKKEVDYIKFDAKKLYFMCKEKGLNAEPRKPKEYYIKLLEGDDKK